MNLPSISVVTPTLNTKRTIEECLRSINIQDYPKELIEVLIIDGGSTDETKEIAQRLGARVIDGGYRNNMEPRRGVGLIVARNELLAYIDSDNILPNNQYFKEMVRPFVDNSEVVAAQTWRFGLKPDFGSFNRYCALIGANDPVAFYLGKSEKVSWLSDRWSVSPILEDHGSYFLTRFNENNLPTVGTNGFMARRELLLKANSQPENFFHIDVIADLVEQGHDLMAMVKNEIYHDTAAQLFNLAYKRMSYFLKHNPFESHRRYLVFDFRKKRDVLGVLRFAFSTITLIEPLSLSVRGFLKKRDLAWFLHLPVCLSFLIAYSFAAMVLSFRVLRQRTLLSFSS